MELDTKHNSQPIFLSENYIKPYMKNEIAFEVPSSKGTYLRDFDLPFHAIGSSLNPFGVQTPCFDSFDTFPYSYSSNFDVYEYKPFENSNGGHDDQVMDNFQIGGYLNNQQVINPTDTLGYDQSHMLLDFLVMKPNQMNFVVPDEVSCVSADNGYYKNKAGMNKNNKRACPSARRTMKVSKKSNVVKGQWTTEEDRLLIRLVGQYGIRKWSHIAQMLPGRIGKQCRERWHNHLRPDIKKDSWSLEEDKALIEAHSEIGNKWAEIAKRLPGRTENSIKNHWNATKRRQFSKRKCRSKYPRGSLLQDYIKSLNLDSSSSKHQRKTSSNGATTAATNTKSKTPNQIPAVAAAEDQDFCPSDRLLPHFDFNEVPDFDFDEKLFQESYSIDCLIEGMPCSPFLDEKSLEMDQVQLDVAPLMESKVKKEMDLVEMISRANL